MKNFRRVFLVLFLVLVGIFNFNFTSKAEGDLKASYQAFFAKEGEYSGWSKDIEDNTKLYYNNQYPPALKVGLVNQPEGMSGTVVYQVNLSGSGWLDPVENRTETGAADINAAPLEAVKIWLNGELANNYDIYYKVLQNGEFGAWIKNGEVAGRFGEGSHISGLVIAITKKDAGEPAESKKLEVNIPHTTAIDPNKPMVALTYDDGPNAHVTSHILTLLEQNNARATFFMVGSNVRPNASLVKRMVKNGNEVGNHTWNHKYLPKLSEAERRNILEMTNSVIAEVSGVSPKLVRAPYGAVDRNTYDTFKTMNMPNILWSIDTLDWKHKNAATSINTVLTHVKDGDIILMHDIYPATAQASDTIIPELIKRGYQLVTVSELSALRGSMQAGRSYSSFRK